MPARSLRAVLFVALTGVAACQVGAIDPAGGGASASGDDDIEATVDAGLPTTAPSYSLAVTPATATTTLGTRASFKVALSAHDFSGPVTLAAGGVPASWQVVIDPPTINLTSAGAMANITVTIPTNADPAAAGARLTIEATAAPGTRSGSAMVMVPNEYVMSIGGGTGTGAHWGVMSGAALRLKGGTRLTIKNDDTMGHRVHTNGGVSGFNHEPDTMGPGESFSVTVGDGQDVFYCHDHGQPTGEVNLIVQ